MSNTKTITADTITARLESGETPEAVAKALSLDFDPSENAVMLPGWVADDGNCEVEFPDAESGEAAAQEYVEGGDWGSDENKTFWIGVCAWRKGFTVEDGEVEEVETDSEAHTIEVNPTEPECEHEDGHDWQSPHELVGGCESNPGVWGNAGGVVINEVCIHCGCGRTTDTWAQNPVTGEQGLTSVEYQEDAFDLSVLDEDAA